MRNTIAGMIAGFMLAIGFGAVSLAPASATTTHQVSACGAPYRATGKSSLTYVATHIASSPISQVLADTAFCHPTAKPYHLPAFPPALVAYVNNGDFTAKLPVGTRLWFSVLP